VLELRAMAKTPPPQGLALWLGRLRVTRVD
jgi:hypothetical protein